MNTHKGGGCILLGRCGFPQGLIVLSVLSWLLSPCLLYHWHPVSEEQCSDMTTTVQSRVSTLYICISSHYELGLHFGVSDACSHSQSSSYLRWSLMISIVTCSKISVRVQAYCPACEMLNFHKIVKRKDNAIDLVSSKTSVCKNTTLTLQMAVCPVALV